MSANSASEKTLFGHPIALYYLFFAELWERFSFYGMRALLVLYLGSEIYQDLMNGKDIAYEIYAAYGALVYFTPAIGGFLADKILGMRFSIVLGGVLMSLGHFAMALPGEKIFFIALGLLIVGNGFFKPNISTMVGGLYAQGDKRRDDAFAFFYMGINIGGFAAPLLCGWLAAVYGWHYGFGLAGIGMLAGLIVFISGFNKGIYKDVGLVPDSVEKSKVPMHRFVTIALSFASVFVFAYLVKHNSLVVFGGQGLLSSMLWVLLAFVVIYVAYECFTTNKVTAGRLIVIMFMCFFITVFWAFFEQAGSSLTYFAEECVNLVLLNAAQTNLINSGYIILLTFPFAAMWGFLSKRKSNPKSPYKFALSLVQLGIGFLIFALSARYMDGAAKVPMLFLMLGWLVVTMGELFISPVGLSKITELAPMRLVSFLMGVWFLSSSFAHYIAGGIAKLTVPKKSDTEYVASNDVLTKFASWASGMNQNEVGSFIFNFDNAYSAVLDTTTLSYPTQQSYKSYVKAISDMGKVNDKWTSASKETIKNLASVPMLIDSLQTFSDSELLNSYNVYAKQFVQKSFVDGFGKAYKLIQEKPTDEDAIAKKERALSKISKKWKVAAQEMLDYEEQMSTTNAAWANTVFDYTNTIQSAKMATKRYPSLATYSKVFAQIAFISFIIALIALLLAPILARLSYGID